MNHFTETFCKALKPWNVETSTLSLSLENINMKIKTWGEENSVPENTLKTFKKVFNSHLTKNDIFDFFIWSVKNDNLVLRFKCDFFLFLLK